MKLTPRTANLISPVTLALDASSSVTAYEVQDGDVLDDVVLFFLVVLLTSSYLKSPFTARLSAAVDFDRCSVTGFTGDENGIEKPCPFDFPVTSNP